MWNRGGDAKVDPAILLAWNSPEEKAQYQQYVDNLRGSIPKGDQYNALKGAMFNKYGAGFNVSDPTVYSEDGLGDSARNALWDVVDRYDATPDHLRGTNSINVIPYNDKFGGKYHIYDPDGKMIDIAMPSPDYSNANAQQWPAKPLYHELSHARTYERDIPWEQQKAFIESGWPGATAGSNSLQEMAINMPYTPAKEGISTSPYGKRSPYDDLADYLGIMSYTQNPENSPSVADLNMANDWFQEDDPRRYQMALDMLKKLQQGKEAQINGP
jgi:hypothetical protein